VVIVCCIVLLALLVVALAACEVEGAVVPRELASAAEVESTAAAFEAVTNAVVKAWSSGDAEAVREIYTDDIVHHDTSFGAHIVGIDDVADMASGFMTAFNGMKSRVADTYVGLEDSLDVWELWNIRLGFHEFTQDDPLVEVDLLETRGDRVSYWTLFYGLDTLDKVAGGATKERLDEAMSLLSSYESAWSSEKHQMVGDLYTRDAVREDTIFRERQEGRDAIISFAETFFAWYPGAQWSLLLPFGDGRGDAPVTGGVYAIKVSGPGDQPCEVHVAVLLKTIDDQIVHEALYYGADTLISCGWAR
jgi:ketosteroid isomerase-like protein